MGAGAPTYCILTLVTSGDWGPGSQGGGICSQLNSLLYKLTSFSSICISMYCLFNYENKEHSEEGRDQEGGKLRRVSGKGAPSGP